MAKQESPETLSEDRESGGAEVMSDGRSLHKLAPIDGKCPFADRSTAEGRHCQTVGIEAVLSLRRLDAQATRMEWNMTTDDQNSETTNFAD